MLNEQIKVDKGIYFGNICYVLSKENYYDFWVNQEKGNDGKFEINGKSFIVHSTYNGDGLYKLFNINSKSKETKYCSVDAGNLGIVDLDLLNQKPISGYIINQAGTYILEADDECNFKLICLDNNEVWICNTKSLKNKYD